jgi:GMP synthase (glutamine-hydrolysing)
MINLANARKDRMITNKYFKDEKVFQNHTNYIKDEDKKLDFQNRTCEVRNWLNFIKKEAN